MKRSPIKRKTKLRPRSKKTEERDRLRKIFVGEQLTRFPYCKAGGAIAVETDGAAGHLRQQPATEIHEPLTRARGGSILDPENAIAVCRFCHIWIHENPAAATNCGLLKNSWEK